MVQIQVAYQGQLRCQATHGPSSNQLLTDAPVDNHGKGEAFSPTDLAATALGTCMLTIIGIVAEKRRLDLTGASAEVIKEMTPEPPRRIAKLAVRISLPIPEGDPSGPLLEKAAFECPVFLSLHPDIEKAVSFVYTG